MITRIDPISEYKQYYCEFGTEDLSQNSEEVFIGHWCDLGDLTNHNGEIKCLLHMNDESRVGYQLDFTEEEISEIKLI